MKPFTLLFLFLIHLVAANSLFAAKTYDFVISYHDTYENTVPAKQSAIEENIKYMADAIYEMSNGAHKVGRVTVYTDGAFKDQADIVWQKDTGDDNKPCWFNAYIGGRLAEKGPYKRIQHCDVGGGNPEFYDTLVKHNMGGYTLAHEQGHYFYGLLDEYAQGASPPASPGSPSSSDSAVPNSVMNSQHEAMAGDMSWLNFSTALNNQGNNAQFRVYAASAWDTLIRPTEQDPSPQRRPYYPELAAAAPAAGQAPPIELTGPETQATARSDIKIEWKRGSEAPSATREGGSNAVPTVRQIVVDLSTHLPSSQLGNIKSSLKQWIDNAKTGEYVSIIGFADTVTAIQPLVRIEGTATKEAIIAAINTMKATGSSPALGDALQFTLQQFSANNAREDLVWAVYLLSSGQQVAGVDPLSLVEAYQGEGVMIYAFDFGKEHDENDLLQQLAEETEGNYWLVKKSNDFTKALKYADEESSPVVDVAFKFDGDTVEGSKDFPFYVDAGISEVAVTIFTVHDGQNETSLTVVDPQGNSRVVAASDCEAIDDEEWEEEGTIATYCEVEITPAPSGTWTLKATANAATDLFYIAYGIPQDSDKVIFASLESLYGEELVSPKPMVLIASVGKGFPITELAVTGDIELPDGSLQDLTWRDDGVAPDLMAKDGLYTARFDYTEAGDYYATVGFNNNAGTAQYTNYGVSYAVNPNGNPEKQFTPVGENFERVADLQILVTAGGSSSTLPILEDGRGQSVSIDSSGTFGKPGAKFSGGVTLDGSSFAAMAKATPQQAVTIKTSIEVAPEDVGKVVDILFVKGIEPPPGPYDGGVKTSYFAYNSQGVITPVDLYNSVDVWMAQLTEPFQAGVTLQSVMPIDLWTGPLNESSMYYFFTGYRLEDGAIIYNTRPVMVHVE